MRSEGSPPQCFTSPYIVLYKGYNPMQPPLIIHIWMISTLYCSWFEHVLTCYSCDLFCTCTYVLLRACTYVRPRANNILLIAKQTNANIQLATWLSGMRTR